MSLGIQNIFRLAANQVVTASTILVNVPALVYPFAANAKVHVTLWLPVTVAGATPGIKVFLALPAGTVSFSGSFIGVNGSTKALDTASILTANAAVTAAFANAANHLVQIDADIVNGTTAGNLQFQFAQAVSDAAAVTLLLGASMQIWLQ